MPDTCGVVERVIDEYCISEPVLNRKEFNQNPFESIWKNNLNQKDPVARSLRFMKGATSESQMRIL